MNFNWQERILIETTAGSHCYGTATYESDKDIRGVIVPTEEYIFGMSRFEQLEPTGEEDTVYHEIRKFLHLSMKGNPAILEIWWAPRLDPIGERAARLRPWWERMKKDLWPCVLSKNILKAHLGMAQAHLKKIEHPGQNCGEKGRKAIEEHGFNTKDAAHVIRVLFQAMELMREGRLTFPRPEAEYLRSIRYGGVPLVEIRRLEQSLVEDIRKVHAACSLQDLPLPGDVNRWLIQHLPEMLEVLR